MRERTREEVAALRDLVWRACEGDEEAKTMVWAMFGVVSEDTTIGIAIGLGVWLSNIVD